MVYLVTTGSRAQVMHGVAHHTKGGLKKSNLKKTKDGRIVSKAASDAAKKRLKLKKSQSKFKKFIEFAKRSKGFKLAPKKGTKAYKKIMRK